MLAVALVTNPAPLCKVVTKRRLFVRKAIWFDLALDLDKLQPLATWTNSTRSRPKNWDTAICKFRLISPPR